MKTPQQIAEQLNDWTGQNITEEEALDLIWALAMDHDLEADLNEAVCRMKNDLATERAREFEGLGEQLTPANSAD